MTTTTITRAGFPKRTPGATFRIPQATSPIAWFTDNTETRADTDNADTWTDHHGTAHERHPDRDDRTWCNTRIIGKDAPTYARVFPIGCHNCATNRTHTT